MTAKTDDRSCATCEFAVWNRAQTPSERLSPTGDGKCYWRVELPAIPKAYRGGMDLSVSNFGLFGGYINRQRPETDCPTYAPIPPKAKPVKKRIPMT